MLGGVAEVLGGVGWSWVKWIYGLYIGWVGLRMQECEGNWVKIKEDCNCDMG